MAKRPVPFWKLVLCAALTFPAYATSPDECKEILSRSAQTRSETSEYLRALPAFSVDKTNNPYRFESWLESGVPTETSAPVRTAREAIENETDPAAALAKAASVVSSLSEALATRPDPSGLSDLQRRLIEWSNIQLARFEHLLRKAIREKEAADKARPEGEDEENSKGRNNDGPEPSPGQGNPAEKGSPSQSPGEDCEGQSPGSSDSKSSCPSPSAKPGSDKGSPSPEGSSGQPDAQGSGEPGSDPEPSADAGSEKDADSGQPGQQSEQQSEQQSGQQPEGPPGNQPVQTPPSAESNPEASPSESRSPEVEPSQEAAAEASTETPGSGEPNEATARADEANKPPSENAKPTDGTSHSVESEVEGTQDEEPSENASEAPTKGKDPLWSLHEAEAVEAAEEGEEPPEEERKGALFPGISSSDADLDDKELPPFALAGDENEENDAKEGTILGGPGGKGAGKEPTPPRSVGKSILDSLLSFLRREEPAETEKPTDPSQMSLAERTAAKLDRIKFRQPPAHEEGEDDHTPAEAMTSLQTIFNHLWVQTLRQYQSHEALMTALTEFRQLCLRAFEKRPYNLFIKQFAHHAFHVMQVLESAQVSYENLSRFANDLVTNIDERSRRLRFLNFLFSEIAQNDHLTSAERAAHEAVQELLAEMSQLNAPVTDVQIGEAFIANLAGPLSLDQLARRFPSGSGMPDPAAVGQAVRNRQADDLLLLLNMRPYLRLFLKSYFTPQDDTKLTNRRLPVPDEDPSVAVALEFENPQRFVRDGSPRRDYFRYETGELLTHQNYRKKLVTGIGNPKKHFLTVAVQDISGSMAQHRKYELRNALVASLSDSSQNVVVMEDAKSDIMSIHFAGSAGNPNLYEGVHSVGAFFNQTLSAPPGSAGGTSITAALIKAIEEVCKYQATHPELEVANVLLISDGDDGGFNLQTVLAAREKVKGQVEINFSIILTEKDNENVKGVLAGQEVEVDGLGKMSYHYIPLAEIPLLLDNDNNRRLLEEVGKDYGPTNPGRRFARGILTRSQRLINNLRHERNRDRFDTRRDLTRFLASSRKAKLRPLFRVGVQRELREFIEFTSEAPATRWSANERSAVLIHFVEGLASQWRCDAGKIIDRFDQVDRDYFESWINRGSVIPVE